MRPLHLVALSAAVADTVLAALPRARTVRRVTKPLVVAPLAAATALDGTDRRVLAGQVLSLAGDVALLGRGDRAFRTGLVCFLGAHAAYLAALAPHAGKPGPATSVAAAAWAGIVPVMSATAARRGLAAPVAVYGTALLGMLGAAGAVDKPAAARGELVAGAGLFVVSDALLGLRELVLRRRVPPLDAAVMATYAAAQHLLAAGFATAHGSASGGRPAAAR